MIEINAKLARADSGIYATGECVECIIEFTNINSNGNQDPNKRNLEENLAWASVQLHCYRKTNYPIGMANPSTTDKSLTADFAGRTALDTAHTQQTQGGDVILATTPKILFCDLKLRSGESKTYFFNEMIPRDGPPTYRGHAIKYFYKITIATQRVMSKVQMLTLPIRILPIPVLLRTDEMPCTEETNDELAPTNPFLEKREISELEISWHHLKNLTARRAPKYYRISNKRGFVGRFCLFKPCYKIGEDIVGSLDFSDCQVRCVQFSVKLQSQEISLHDPILHGHQNINNSSEANDSNSVYSLDLASVASGTAIDNLHKSITSGSVRKSTGSGVDNDDDDELSGKVNTFATSHQMCYCIQQTQVVIPIPLHITPSFQTNLVDLRWRLHFEFVTSVVMDFGEPDPITNELQAPAEIPVETMIWNLPLSLYAANPLQIYAPNEAHTLLIK